MDARHSAGTRSTAVSTVLPLMLLTALASCSVESDPTTLSSVSLAVRTTVAGPQRVPILEIVDRARVRVVRPPGDIIAQASVAVPTGQSTLTVDIQVELEAAVEELLISVELLVGDVVALAGEATTLVDVSQPVNEGPVIVLVAVAPALEARPAQLVSEVHPGGDPAELSFSVRNIGGAPLSWSAAPDVPWLTLSPESGGLTQEESADVTVLVNPLDLDPGTYGGLVTVEAPLAVNSPETVEVAVTVLERGAIGLSAPSLAFETVERESPAPQSFVLSNTGGSPLNWTAASDVPWLGLAPAAGMLVPQQAVSVTVAASTGNLEPGSHSGTITLQDPLASNSPQTLAVTVLVTEAPAIGVSAPSLTFETLELTNPMDQQVTVSNEGGGTVHWSVAWSTPWLDVTPSAGSLTSTQEVELTVAVSTQNLSPGEYADSLTFSDPDASNSPVVVPVMLTVTQSPEIYRAPESFVFDECYEYISDSWTILNNGGSTLRWQAISDQSWLSVTPSSGSLAPNEAQDGTVSGAWGLPYPSKGYYEGTITIHDPNASNSPQLIHVVLYPCSGAVAPR